MSRVFLTGVLRSHPEKCWNGLPVIPSSPGPSAALVIGAGLGRLNGRGMAASALVNEPLTWPKKALSNSSSGMAPQLSA